MKKWLKVDAFWTTKGGMKSSDKKNDKVSLKKEPLFVGKKKSNNSGRPNCLDREKLSRLLEAYYSHPYSFRELADMFGVSRMTVWRAVQDATSLIPEKAVS